MPKEIRTEEQKRGQYLFRCYRKGLSLIWFVGVLLWWLSFLLTNIEKHLLALTGFGLVSVASYAYTSWFARRLSRQEINAINQFGLPDNFFFIFHIDKARKLNHAHERIHGNFDDDSLLRASQEPQNDTLLRAAQYTDEKAQEQLLRPTDTPP